MSTLPIRTVYQGDTVNLEFEAQDVTGQAQDLDGCAIRWAMSDPATIDTPILTKTTGSGITVIDAAAGRLRVAIAAGDIDTPGNYVHELEITLPSGETYTYGQGPFIVKPTVLPS